MAGDYTHNGEFFKFPATTSSPKPLQKPHPPIWVAARDPNSHEFAVANGCNVQVTPLWQDDDEVRSLIGRFNDACTKSPEVERPKIMLLRHTYVGSDEVDIAQAAHEMSVYYNYFFAWFKNERPITQGLIERIPDEEIAANAMLSAEAMRRNNVVGAADEVIARIKSYEAMGYDEYSFWIDTGMTFERKKASLERFMRRGHAGVCGVSQMQRFQCYIDGEFGDGEAGSKASTRRRAVPGRRCRRRAKPIRSRRWSGAQCPLWRSMA